MPRSRLSLCLILTTSYFLYDLVLFVRVCERRIAMTNSKIHSCVVMYNTITEVHGCLDERSSLTECISTDLPIVFSGNDCSNLLKQHRKDTFMCAIKMLFRKVQTNLLAERPIWSASLSCTVLYFL